MPLVGLVNELRQENKTFLRQIHQKLERNEVMDGFWREQGLWREEDVREVVSVVLLEGNVKPLPTRYGVWEDVLMDFIMGLSVYKGLLVMLVVVDRFTKYAHFGTLHYGFNVTKVAEVFMDMLVKLHGIPKPIMSNRDRIIVSKFWKQLFEAIGTKLNHSMTYHPQTDGQTKVVNRGLEQYLRAMVIKMTSYQAVYGRVPPLIIPYLPESAKVAVVEELLIELDVLLRQLKQNLAHAKNQMEMQVNMKRYDISLIQVICLPCGDDSDGSVNAGDVEVVKTLQEALQSPR
nr:Ty3/gypsy retrotransposon protein [Tanacetum cinerariifolium]